MARTWCLSWYKTDFYVKLVNLSNFVGLGDFAGFFLFLALLFNFCLFRLDWCVSVWVLVWIICVDFGCLMVRRVWVGVGRYCGLGFGGICFA